MSYKRYIKKGGKVYGPYTYHSKKVNGHVISEYYGKDEIKKSYGDAFQLAALFCFVLVTFVAVYYLPSLTGSAVLSVDNTYLPGENISGSVTLSLNPGELIPADSLLSINNSGQISQYLLSDLISDDATEGYFYLDNILINGSGSGFGVPGEKKVYPAVDFDFRIVKVSRDSEITGGNENTGETETNGTSQEDQESQETDENNKPSVESSSEPPAGLPVEEDKPEELIEKSGNQDEQEQTQTDESASSGSENTDGTIVGEDSADSGPVLTGSAVSEDAMNEGKISASVSKGNSFSYALAEGETIEIIPGSVKSGGKKVEVSEIRLEQKGTSVSFTTGYSETEEGFGEDYISDGSYDINIGLSNLGLAAKSGKFDVLVVYNDVGIVSASENIEVDDSLNETNEAETNDTILNNTSINQTIGNVTIFNNSVINQTITNVTEINITETNITGVNITETNITVLNNTPINQTIINITGVNITEINITRANTTVVNVTEVNITAINVSSINLTTSNITIKTVQYGAVLNKPVKWKKTIQSDKPANVTISLPKDITNVSIYRIDDIESDKRVKIAEGDDVNLVEIEPEGNVEENDSETGNNTETKENASEENVNFSETGKGISGNVVLKLNIKNKKQGILPRIYNRFAHPFNFLTGRAVSTKPSDNSTDITLEENAPAYEIEYETPAPSSAEREISNGKEVIVSGPEDVHYQNILAYSTLPKNISINEISKIKLYWITTETASEVSETSGNTTFEQVVISSTGDILQVTTNATNVNSENNFNTGSLNNTVSNNSISNNTSNNATSSGNTTNSDSVNSTLNNESSQNGTAQLPSQDNNSKTSGNESFSITGKAVLDINEPQKSTNSENNSTSANNSEVNTGNTNKSEPNIVSANTSGENSGEAVISNKSSVSSVIAKRIEINFTAVDEDNDSIVDYIEWNVPHLSNQTYEIIVITKAEHLDSNRTFISDIYDYVKEKDNNWSETIPAGDYVRISFERNLTKDNDITVYARAGCEENSTFLINGLEVPCDIYLKKLRIDELRRLLE